MKNDPSHKPQFTISKMTADDIYAATVMRLQSWTDTYVNEEHGVTREWVEARNKTQIAPEFIEARKKRFAEKKFGGWVAKNEAGDIIGSTTPFIDETGAQRVGSLYVDKAYHGTGVGAALMEKVIKWADPTKPIKLGVVSYNQRARAFYKKWGFEEVNGSEHIEFDVIPVIDMIRHEGVKP